jgi:hypothetical protein
MIHRYTHRLIGQGRKLINRRSMKRKPIWKMSESHLPFRSNRFLWLLRIFLVPMEIDQTYNKATYQIQREGCGRAVHGLLHPVSPAIINETSCGSGRADRSQTVGVVVGVGVGPVIRQVAVIIPGIGYPIHTRRCPASYGIRFYALQHPGIFIHWQL